MNDMMQKKITFDAVLYKGFSAVNFLGIFYSKFTIIGNPWWVHY